MAIDVCFAPQVSKLQAEKSVRIKNMTQSAKRQRTCREVAQAQQATATAACKITIEAAKATMKQVALEVADRLQDAEFESLLQDCARLQRFLSKLPETQFEVVAFEVAPDLYAKMHVQWTLLRSAKAHVASASEFADTARKAADTGGAQVDPTLVTTSAEHLTCGVSCLVPKHIIGVSLICLNRTLPLIAGLVTVLADALQRKNNCRRSHQLGTRASRSCMKSMGCFGKRAGCMSPTTRYSFRSILMAIATWTALCFSNPS